ncbi:MAG TPA: hypothetical protein VGF79_03405, partial [Bacteroidia bacterium]
MKTKLYIKVIVLCFIGFNKDIQAQCYDQPTTKSTDWRNYPASSANDWDWTLNRAIHPVYLSNNLSTPSLYIELPYYCTKPLGSGSCDGTQNVLNYQFLGNSAKYQDINPEDGWELLLKDFGTPNPAGQNNGGTGRSNPYFILYNKFTGKMKIYMALMGIQNKQAAFIRIGFDNYEPGTTKIYATNQANRALFSNAEPIQKTVLEFKPVLEFKQMNQVLQFQNQLNYQWTVCELTTSYDPCTCLNPDDHANKISTLRMQLVNVGTVDIEATIDGRATPLGSVAQSSDASSTVNGSLASFFKVATDAGNAAQKGASDWNNTQSTMNQIIDFGNDVLIKHLAKEWLRKDNPNFDEFTLKSMNKTALKNLLGAPDSIKQMFGVRQPSSTKLGKVLEASKGIASNLPYVGMAIGIVDYFMAGGGESAGQEKSGPVTYDINLRLHGTLTEKQSVADVTFYTPGSPIPSNTSSHLNPIYNNILGVFNILELPDVEFAEIGNNLSREDVVNKLSSASFCQYNYDNFNDLENANAIKFRQYRPKSDIKYVLNPASNLEVVSIDAAIVFEYKHNQNLFPNKIVDFLNSSAIPFHGDMVLNNNQLTLEDRVNNLENSSNLKLEYVSRNYPLDTTSMIRFRTNYIPITCFTSLDFTLLGSDNFGEIYVKLYIRLKRKNSPNSEPITLVQTLDWKEKVIHATKLSDLSGTFTTSLYANKMTTTPRYFKCKTDLFNSRNYSEYVFKSKFNITQLAFNDKGLYLGNNYSYSNEQYLTVQDRLIIPSGAIIPDNSVIKAGGVVTIKPNVVLGSNVKIISAVQIDLQYPNTLGPD